MARRMTQDEMIAGQLDERAFALMERSKDTLGRTYQLKDNIETTSQRTILNLGNLQTNLDKLESEMEELREMLKGAVLDLRQTATGREAEQAIKKVENLGFHELIHRSGFENRARELVKREL